MIRPVMVYEAVCDCGCGRKLSLGADVARFPIYLAMQGWRTEGKAHLSGFCNLAKAKRQRKAKP